MSNKKYAISLEKSDGFSGRYFFENAFYQGEFEAINAGQNHFYIAEVVEIKGEEVLPSKEWMEERMLEDFHADTDEEPCVYGLKAFMAEIKKAANKYLNFNYFNVKNIRKIQILTGDENGN